MTFPLYLAGRKCASLLVRTLASDGTAPPDDADGVNGADGAGPVGFPSLSEIQRETALREASRLFDAPTVSLSGKGSSAAVLPATLCAVPGDEEAVFSNVPVRVDGKECTVDFLLPVPGEGWRGVLVRPTSRMRREAIREAAFQRICLREAGVPVAGWELANLNPKYRREERLDPRSLFRRNDIGGQVEELLPEVEREVEEIERAVRAAEANRTAEGFHACAFPRSCPFAAACRPELPEHHVFTLHHGRQTADELAARGIFSIDAIPDDVFLTRKQQIQRRAVRTGLPQIDRRALGRFLKKLDYPLFFLDFEAFALAVPPYPGMYPFQHVPFQYSLLVLREPDAEPEEHAFLARGAEDPRPELSGRLLPLLEESGSIVVYDQRFEKRILSELAEELPGYRTRIDSVLSRIRDLYGPFGSFAYYHPGQKGRASIKKILPLLTGSDYRDLDVSDGGEASARFLSLRHPNGRTDSRCEETVRRQLLAYCRMDTEAMMRILAVLSRIHADGGEA